MLCPKCKHELDEELTSCPICGNDVDQVRTDWVAVGHIEDKISADFVRATLESYEIPSVVVSRGGFFGSAGLPLMPFFASQPMAFEISVPSPFVEETIEILRMTLGERWQQAKPH